MKKLFPLIPIVVCWGCLDIATTIFTQPTQVQQQNPGPSPSPSVNCTPTQVQVRTANGLASITRNNPTTLLASATFSDAVCQVSGTDWGVLPEGSCTFSNAAGNQVTTRCDPPQDVSSVTIQATINGVTGQSTFKVG